jgi:hypothetical protein
LKNVLFDKDHFRIGDERVNAPAPEQVESAEVLQRFPQIA